MAYKLLAKKNNFNNSQESEQTSLYRVIVFLIFIFSLLSVRVLTPFGDEPDFTIRALELVAGEYPAWLPYNIFQSMLSTFDLDRNSIYTNCLVISSPTDIFSYIGDGCRESNWQIAKRIFITFFIISPVFFLYLSNSLRSFVFKFYRGSKPSLEYRVDILAHSLLFPGLIYYISVLSVEQFSLSLSFYLFLFFNNFILSSLILILILSVDIGNGFVVLIFLTVFYFQRALAVTFGKFFSLTFLFLLVLIALYVGVDIIKYASIIPQLSEKVDGIYAKSLISDFQNKYPIFFRPFVAFMTGTFMTPSGIKVLPAYFLVLAFILTFWRRTKYEKRTGGTGYLKFGQNYDYNDVLKIKSASAAFIITTIALIFIIPDYSNAKYYVFIIPFLIGSAGTVFSRGEILSFMILMNFLTVLVLMIYRI